MTSHEVIASDLSNTGRRAGRNSWDKLFPPWLTTLISLPCCIELAVICSTAGNDTGAGKNPELFLDFNERASDASPLTMIMFAIML